MTEMTVADRKAKILELEGRQDELAVLENLKIDQFEEELGNLEKERQDAVNFSVRMKQIVAGNPGSLNMTIAVADNPEKPKAQETMKLGFDRVFLTAYPEASRTIGGLADLLVQEKHSRVNEFLSKNQALQNASHNRKLATAGNR